MCLYVILFVEFRKKRNIFLLLYKSRGDFVVLKINEYNYYILFFVILFVPFRFKIPSEKHGTKKKLYCDLTSTMWSFAVSTFIWQMFIVNACIKIKFPF